MKNWWWAELQFAVTIIDHSVWNAIFSVQLLLNHHLSSKTPTLLSPQLIRTNIQLWKNRLTADVYKKSTNGRCKTRSRPVSAHKNCVLNLKWSLFRKTDLSKVFGWCSLDSGTEFFLIFVQRFFHNTYVPSYVKYTYNFIHWLNRKRWCTNAKVIARGRVPLLVQKFQVALRKMEKNKPMSAAFFVWRNVRFNPEGHS
jgi:hypothetical protein